ncbi:MAG: winged helix-turn-helix domain-containing protein, partial [Dongiaceae bacterium]
TLRVSVLGEPQMGRRGLYPTLGGAAASRAIATRMNVLAYADGTRDLLSIAETLGEPIWVLAPVVAELVEHDLIADIETLPE